MNKHLIILKTLKELHKKNPHVVSECLESDNDMGILRMLFANLRKDDDNNLIGFRLTSLGLSIFQHYFKSYEHPHSENFIVSSICLLTLDRYSDMPWFIDGHRTILFDKKLMFKLKMAGSLDKLVKLLQTDFEK